MNQLHWFTICSFFNLLLFWKWCMRLRTYFRRCIFHQSEYCSKNSASKEITASKEKNPLSSHSSVHWSPPTEFNHHEQFHSSLTNARHIIMQLHAVLEALLSDILKAALQNIFCLSNRTYFSLIMVLSNFNMHINTESFFSLTSVIISWQSSQEPHSYPLRLVLSACNPDICGVPHDLSSGKCDKSQYFSLDMNSSNWDQYEFRFAE